MATKSDEDAHSMANDDEERSGSPLSALSLDVLAQVASDRLQTDNARIAKKNKMYLKAKKKNPTAKRNLQTMDILDLSLITTLSDKLLLNMYTEMTSDEIRKMYTLSCYLEPGICNHQVSVYGNEMKAKIEMKHHLHCHIKQLQERYKENPEDFTAETALGRKKRIQSEHNKQARMKKKLKKEPPPSNVINGMKRRGRPPNFPQTLHDYAGLGVAIDKGLLEKDAQKKHRIEKFRMDVIEKYLSPDEDENANQESKKDTVKIEPESDCENNKENTEELEEEEVEQEQEPAKPVPVESTFSETVPETAVPENEPESEPSEPSKEDLDKEQLIIDLMSKSQPYQDHNYTSILGKKRGIETMQQDWEIDEELEEELFGLSHCCRTLGKRLGGSVNINVLPDIRPNVTLTLDTETVSEASGQTFPVVKMPPLPVKEGIAGTARNYAILSQEIIAWEELKRLASKMTQKRSAYPPMPQANLDKQGRIPEENLLGTPSSDQDEETPKEIRKIVNPFKRGRRGFDTMGGEWERKMALKCIRELRSASKKKEETSLVCKICKSRTFTATATLMYHYRSHAGIKPFVCLICNTTFTRQHSLNYHMLIHNNQSRFTCRECGRKFRHPSHFKEHMRRHTGETPYHCTDCPLRFKTRNTYKRHLRTRHDKMLTSVGIQNLIVDDAEQYKGIVKEERTEQESGDIEVDDPLKSGKKIKDIIQQTDSNFKGIPKIIKTEIGSGFTQTSVQVSVANTPQVNKLSGIQAVIPIQPAKPIASLQQQLPSASVGIISSATTTVPAQMLSTSGGTLQLQLPNMSQTLNISGLQLQLPGQQLQVPMMQAGNTAVVQPILQTTNNTNATASQAATQIQMPIIHAAHTGQQIHMPILQAQTINGQAAQQIHVPIVQAHNLAGQAGSQIQVPVVQAQSISGQSTAQIQVPLLQTQALTVQNSSNIQVPIQPQQQAINSQAVSPFQILPAQSAIPAQVGSKIQLPIIQSTSSSKLPRLQIPVIRPQAILAQAGNVQQQAVAQFTQVTPGAAGTAQLLLTPTTHGNSQQTGIPVVPLNQATFQLGTFTSQNGTIQQIGAGNLQTVQASTTGLSLVPVNAGAAVNNGTLVSLSSAGATGNAALIPINQGGSSINNATFIPVNQGGAVSNATLVPVNQSRIVSNSTMLPLSQSEVVNKDLLKPVSTIGRTVNNGTESIKSNTLSANSRIDTTHLISSNTHFISSTSPHSLVTNVAPNTPAANTLLRFCTEVANQAGQVGSVSSSTGS